MDRLRTPAALLVLLVFPGVLATISSTSGTTEAPATTAPPSKHGICPVVPTSPTGAACSSTCSLDSDCTGTLKCCRSSCQGTKCTCPVVRCRLLCRYGYLKNKEGCNICSCASPKTTQPPSATTASPVTTQTLTYCQQIQRQIGLPPRRGRRATKPVGSYYPACDNDGDFEMLQCPSPKVSDCFCVNMVTGIPLTNYHVVQTAGVATCVRGSVPATTIPLTSPTASSHATAATCPPHKPCPLCPNGYVYRDGCQTCQCKPTTTRVPPTTTTTTTVLNCTMSNGTVIAAGTSYNKGPCTTCRCRIGGKIACLVRDCPRISCPTGQQPVWRNGACCPTCMSVATTTSQPSVTCPPLPPCTPCPPGTKPVYFRGCPTCTCKPATPTTTTPTPTAATCPPPEPCPLCPNGYVYQNGCRTCQCKPTTTKTPPVTTTRTPPVTTTRTPPVATTRTPPVTTTRTPPVATTKTPPSTTTAPQGCTLSNGTVIAVGMSYAAGVCTHCSCYAPDTLPVCHAIRCATPSCPSGQTPMPKIGVCCMVCQAVPTTPTPPAGCTLPNGTVVTVGVSYFVRTCGVCTCQFAGSAPLCYDVACGRRTCGPGAVLVNKSGQCCPVCESSTTAPTPAAPTCPPRQPCPPCLNGFVYNNGCPTCTCKSSNATGCTFADGLVVPLGRSYWPVLCTVCSCLTVGSEPKFLCRNLQCTQPNCSIGQTLVRKSGHCCKTCEPVTNKTGCAMANGTAVAVGTHYYTGDASNCRSCQCQAAGSQPACIGVQCATTCPTGKTLIQRSGRCCPACGTMTGSPSAATTGASIAATTAATTTAVPVFQLHMECMLVGTESATSDLLTQPAIMEAFKLYFAEWLIAQYYPLKSQNIRDIQVFSLLSSNAALVSYSLVAFSSDSEPLIRTTKTKIDSDVQNIEPQLKVAAGKYGVLEYTMQPRSNTVTKTTEAKPTPYKNNQGGSSGGLSNVALIAISVGGGVVFAILAVLVIVVVKIRRKASSPYFREAPSDLGQASYTVKGDVSINSSSPNFDEPLYDSDTHQLVAE